MYAKQPSGNSFSGAGNRDGSTSSGFPIKNWQATLLANLFRTINMNSWNVTVSGFRHKSVRSRSVSSICWEMSFADGGDPDSSTPLLLLLVETLHSAIPLFQKLHSRPLEMARVGVPSKSFPTNRNSASNTISSDKRNGPPSSGGYIRITSPSTSGVTMNR